MKMPFVLMAVLPIAVFAQPQFLDPGFGTGGKVTTAVGGTLDMAFSVALQVDGKVVAAGDTRTGGAATWALTRYKHDGSPDSAFGAAGIVKTVIGTFSSAAAVAVLGNGKIIAGGASLGTTLDLTLAKYKADGSLDSGFSGDGIATLHAGTGVNAPRSMALQSDGKIILAGRDAAGFLLARFDSTGAPDASFGSGGSVLTAFTGGAADAYSVAVLPGGKILAAGTVNGKVAMARYHGNGILDSSFGTAGKVISNPGFSGAAAAIQADGKILVGGEASPNPYDFAVARYDSLGAIDSSFGTGGVVKTDIAGASRDHVASIAIQPDGKIVVGGYAGQVASMANLGFALVRYTEKGVLDESFGSGGKITTDFGGGNNTISSVALQSDGKIVAVGGFSSGAPGFTLARYYAPSTGIPWLTGSRDPGSMRLIRANGKAVLRYGLERSGTVSIRIFDAYGKSVKTILGNADRAEGSHDQPIDLPAGARHGRYFIVLSTARETAGLEIVK